MSKGFWYRWVVVAVVAGGVAYAGIVSTRHVTVRSRLNDLLKETVEEKDKLQSTILSMESQIRDKDGQLSQLRDVQSIRQSLASAQETIEIINKELERVNRERAALQETNLSTTSRLQKTTKEYMRALDDLKKAQDDVARVSREMSPDKKKLNDTERMVQAKSLELSKLQADTAKQRQLYDQVLAQNKALEKKVQDLESEKASLNDTMRQLDVDVSKQGTPIRALRDTVAQLKTQLSRKENQIAALESELAKADMAVSGRARGAQSGAVRDTAQSQEQDRKLSEILVKKEIELDANRKEASNARDKIMSLQSKIANLESTIAMRNETQDRIRELDSERLALESKLSDAQASLSKKAELSQNLQQNVDYLNQQLAARDREKKDLEARLSGIDVNSKQDLEKERARYNEINTLYNSLKTQISQFSDTLNAKTEELEKRNKDVYALREELTSLKSKTMIMENELSETRDRQRKTLDDLIAAVRLNSILQDRIAGGASIPYADMDDKQKAEELRRKVEVILVPPDKR